MRFLLLPAMTFAAAVAPQASHAQDLPKVFNAEVMSHRVLAAADYPSNYTLDSMRTEMLGDLRLTISSVQIGQTLSTSVALTNATGQAYCLYAKVDIAMRGANRDRMTKLVGSA